MTTGGTIRDGQRRSKTAARASNQLTPEFITARPTAGACDGHLIEIAPPIIVLFDRISLSHALALNPSRIMHLFIWTPLSATPVYGAFGNIPTKRRSFFLLWSR